MPRHVGETIRGFSRIPACGANFGQKSLDEVKQKLDERGLSLRG